MHILSFAYTKYIILHILNFYPRQLNSPPARSSRVHRPKVYSDLKRGPPHVPCRYLPENYQQPLVVSRVSNG